jgi:WhiB family redox-sensing transcriptional regulator
MGEIGPFVDVVGTNDGDQRMSLGQPVAARAESGAMDRDWVNRSACKGLDPTIFYPATDEEADEAKAVCFACPVQGDCLEHAIGNREHNGVWGGATERERQRIIRRRRRLRANGSPVDGVGLEVLGAVR